MSYENIVRVSFCYTNEMIKPVVTRIFIIRLKGIFLGHLKCVCNCILYISANSRQELKAVNFSLSAFMTQHC